MLPVPPIKSKLPPVPKPKALKYDTDLFETSAVRPPPPLICLAENLPAFDSMKTAVEYGKRYLGDAVSLVKSWQCEQCGAVHVRWKLPPPSGSTSGRIRGGQNAPLMGKYNGVSHKETMRRIAALPEDYYI